MAFKFKDNPPYPKSVSMTRDKEGYRTYKAVFQLRSDDPADGPTQVLLTPGLPSYGDPWDYGNDNDPWCTCRQDADVKQMYSGEPVKDYEVTLTFTNKDDEKKCKDQQIDDPLLKPPEISGSFAKDKFQTTIDRFGQPIVNSAFEPFHGPPVEFDRSQLTVKIKMNVADLQLDLLNELAEKVNDQPLWGLPARSIKLSHVSWDRKFHGQCNVYYEWTLEFESKVRSDTTAGNEGEIVSGWDRDLLDEASKVLSGHWGVQANDGTTNWVLDPVKRDGSTPDPDPTDPTHFIKAFDRQSKPCKVILDGFGVPIPLIPKQAYARISEMQVINPNNPLLQTITAVEVTNPGAGYDNLNPPMVNPVGDALVMPVFSATVVGGQVTRIQVVSGGQIDTGGTAIGGGGVEQSIEVAIDPPPNADQTPGNIHVEYYEEGDFTQLGIPLTF